MDRILKHITLHSSLLILHPPFFTLNPTPSIPSTFSLTVEVEFDIEETLLVSSYQLGEMLEGDSADMCAEKFPLMLMGGRAEGLACADPGARTLIGVSRIILVLLKTHIFIFIIANEFQINVRRKKIRGPHIQHFLGRQRGRILQSCLRILKFQRERKTWWGKS